MELKTDKNDKDSKYYLLILTGSYLTVLGLDEPYLGITKPYLGLIWPYWGHTWPYWGLTLPYWAFFGPS